MAVTIVIHVQPRARHTEVVGWHGDAVKIRLAAPPIDGAANDELIRFLADRLEVPRASVSLVAGTATRRKRVTVQGVDEEGALQRLGLSGR